MDNHSVSEITAWSVFSVLAGTVVSSVVAYLLQRRAFSEAREQKAEDKFEARKALALNIFHKMLRISSTLNILYASVVECFARAKKDGIRGQNWQVVTPIANFPDQVRFTAEERTFLMLLDLDLFNDLGPFDDIHNSLLSVFEVYAARRIALSEALTAKMNGMVGTTELPEAEAAKLAPKMAELNFLVEQMLARSQRDSDEAWLLLEKLREKINQEFSLHLTIRPPGSPSPI